MKKTLLFIVITAFSCAQEVEHSGYNCENGTCIATFDNPTYLTLQDCQSACGSNSGTTPNPNAPGSIYFYVTFNPICYAYGTSMYAFAQVTLGYGYTSTDISNDAYIGSWGFADNGHKTVNNVKPGIYYYKATKTSKDTEHCPTVVKSGSFTVPSGKPVNVNISF